MKRTSFDKIKLGEEFLYFGEEHVKTGEDRALRLEDGKTIFIAKTKGVQVWE
jgi:hypothetical protein|tara:strand:+ start:265 stop:420 length:156 start_codon:yes stop_codon:yes gene_type:complete